MGTRYVGRKPRIRSATTKELIPATNLHNKIESSTFQNDSNQLIEPPKKRLAHVRRYIGHEVVQRRVARTPKEKLANKIRAQRSKVEILDEEIERKFLASGSKKTRVFYDSKVDSELSSVLTQKLFMNNNNKQHLFRKLEGDLRKALIGVKDPRKRIGFASDAFWKVIEAVPLVRDVLFQIKLRMDIEVVEKFRALDIVEPVSCALISQTKPAFVDEKIQQTEMTHEIVVVRKKPPESRMARIMNEQRAINVNQSVIDLYQYQCHSDSTALKYSATCILIYQIIKTIRQHNKVIGETVQKLWEQILVITRQVFQIRKTHMRSIDSVKESIIKEIEDMNNSVNNMNEKDQAVEEDIRKLEVDISFLIDNQTKCKSSGSSLILKVQLLETEVNGSKHQLDLLHRKTLALKNKNLAKSILFLSKSNRLDAQSRLDLEDKIQQQRIIQLEAEEAFMVSKFNNEESIRSGETVQLAVSKIEENRARSLFHEKKAQDKRDLQVKLDSKTRKESVVTLKNATARFLSLKTKRLIQTRDASVMTNEQEWFWPISKTAPQAKRWHLQKETWILKNNKNLTNRNKYIPISFTKHLQLVPASYKPRANSSTLKQVRYQIFLIYAAISKCAFSSLDGIRLLCRDYFANINGLQGGELRILDFLMEIENLKASDNWIYAFAEFMGMNPVDGTDEGLLQECQYDVMDFSFISRACDSVSPYGNVNTTVTTWEEIFQKLKVEIPAESGHTDQILLGLLDHWLKIKPSTVERLESLFVAGNCAGDGIIPFQQFTTTVRATDPNLSKSDVVEMYTRALRAGNNSETVEKRDFVSSAMFYNLMLPGSWSSANLGIAVTCRDQNVSLEKLSYEGLKRLYEIHRDSIQVTVDKKENSMDSEPNPHRLRLNHFQELFENYHSNPKAAWFSFWLLIYQLDRTARSKQTTHTLGSVQYLMRWKLRMRKLLDAPVLAARRQKLHPVFSKCRWHRTKDMQRLLDGDRNNEPFDVSETDDCLNTLLHIAVQNNHEDYIQLLVDRGVDINAQNLTGQTCMHFAKYYKHKRIFFLLRRAGADDAITNNAGLSCHELFEGGEGGLQVRSKNHKRIK